MTYSRASLPGPPSFPDSGLSGRLCSCCLSHPCWHLGKAPGRTAPVLPAERAVGWLSPHPFRTGQPVFRPATPPASGRRRTKEPRCLEPERRKKVPFCCLPNAEAALPARFSVPRESGRVEAAITPCSSQSRSVTLAPACPLPLGFVVSVLFTLRARSRVAGARARSRARDREWSPSCGLGHVTWLFGALASVNRGSEGSIPRSLPGLPEPSATSWAAAAARACRPREIGVRAGWVPSGSEGEPLQASLLARGGFPVPSWVDVSADLCLHLCVRDRLLVQVYSLSEDTGRPA